MVDNPAACGWWSPSNQYQLPNPAGPSRDYNLFDRRVTPTQPIKTLRWHYSSVKEILIISCQLFQMGHGYRLDGD